MCEGGKLETNRMSSGKMEMGEKLTIKGRNACEKILLEKRATGHVI